MVILIIDHIILWFVVDNQAELCYDLLDEIDFIAGLFFLPLLVVSAPGLILSPGAEYFVKQIRRIACILAARKYCVMKNR